MGIIIYDGPSVLDGSPVLGVVTGALEGRVQRPTSNKKIAHGYAVQLWIIQRDLHPLDALRTGGDAGVCGACPLRPQADRARLCYVNPMTISQVWKHVRRPDVERLTPYEVGRHRMGLARYVRLGAYGDPVALPFEVCDDLLRGARAAGARAWSGYTHAWRSDVAEPFKKVLMASCDSISEQTEAQSRGWRTFTILPRNYNQTVAGAIDCPASSESGKLTTCATCRLCNGKKGVDDLRKSITIQAHGPGAKALSNYVNHLHTL